jgi:hypothetical protein
MSWAIARCCSAGGSFADKWDYFPASYDPIYPWATGNPSVIRTSVIFWSLAELEADRRAPWLARREDDTGDGDPDIALRNPGSADGPASGAAHGGAPHADEPAAASTDSLMLAVIMGHELGAPSLAASSAPEDGGDLTRRGGTRSATAPAQASAAPSSTKATGDASGRAAGALESATGTASVTRLGSIAPNPARRGCEIAFSLAREGEVRLEIFDVTGRRVRTLESGRLAAGAHLARWDGRDATGGVAGAGLYFAALTTPDGRVVARFAVSP